MKKYTQIEITSMTMPPIDMGGFLLCLDRGDILTIADLKRGADLAIRDNEIGDSDAKISSTLAAYFCLMEIAKPYEKEKD